jgi:membrane protease YdiL (CAAX protease family)
VELELGSLPRVTRFPLDTYPGNSYNGNMKRQVIIVWFAVFLLWAFYRAYFINPEWLDELIVKPVFFILPVFFAVLVFEKQTLATLGIAPSLRNFFLDLYAGVVLGILFAFEGIFANYIKNGEIAFAPILASKVSGGMGFFLLLNLATSVSEEILGRGYIYQRLYQASKNQFGAALLSSLLFLLLHVPIMLTQLHLMGTSLILYTVSIFLLGMANSYLYTLRGSLTLPVLVHTFWNMTVALYL